MSFFKQRVGPAIFVLCGIGLFLLPFVGSQSESAKHKKALNVICFLGGAFFVIYPGYYMIKGRAPARP